MRKKMVYLLAVFIVLGLAACNQLPGDAKEKTGAVQPQEKSPSNVSEDKVYHNEVFNDVVVAESEDKIVVTGKAQVFEGVFQYALYEGDNVLKQDKYQTAGAPAWGTFKITFEKKSVPSKDAKIELFVYSAKDGSKVNILEIPLRKTSD